MPDQPQSNPVEAFQRIKSAMRRHWLEQLEADLKVVEAALQGASGSAPPQPRPEEHEEGDPAPAPAHNPRTTGRRPGA